MGDSSATRHLLALNLKRLRLDAGLSQMALAGRVGVAPNFINAIEQQKKWVSGETLDRLALTLQVPVAEFFRAETPANPDPRSIARELRRRVDQVFDSFNNEVGRSQG